MSRPPPSRRASPRGAARLGFAAALQWVGLEFGLRYGMLVGGGLLLLARGWVAQEDLLGPLGAGLNLAAGGVAMVALGAVFLRRRAVEGLTWSEVGYRWCWRNVRAGLIATGVLLVLLEGTHVIDERAFEPRDILRGVRWTEEEELGALVGGGAGVGALLIAVNGILVPLAEELAWRGYVQTRWRLAWGPGPALLLTAAAFAGKHVIVDLSIERTSTLLVGSFVLGLVRHRWGTGASTVTHLLGNLSGVVRVLLAGRR